MNFSQLGLAPAQVSACESLGYITPTPIQRQAIPVVLTGRDVIGCAETGTGKTAAFLLPIIQRLSEKARPGVRVLVLAPTRELALQIQENYKELNSVKTNRSVLAIGGANIRTQLADLRRGATVLIATPGRLLDLIERRAVELSAIEVLVLDEADRMLDMGFLPAIRRVLALLPAKRQTLLFSATMSSSIEQLARSTTKDPKLVEVNTRGQAPSLVEQTAYYVGQESKTALLIELLEKEREPFERVLIFTRTRRGAERLSHVLAARDHSVKRIHADRTQSQREAALRAFSEGHARILVATDIAARGLDISSVSHVVNYDVPSAPEDYVHRIGRTGRAGNQGKAITIVAPVDELSMRAIERLTGQSVRRIVPEGFSKSANVSVVRSVHQPAAPRFSPPRSPSTRSFRPRRASRYA
ncbi:MAG TPA: DEAD/DEAH box helicase [Pyrinomonadaceae bacterium]|nr:DEAD/DEAH box helicase [Pyrinomonadaceae bacterium]